MRKILYDFGGKDKLKKVSLRMKFYETGSETMQHTYAKYILKLLKGIQTKT